VNQYEALLFGGVIAFYVPAFGLFHWMIFKVNRNLPLDRRIPHSLYFGEWKRLASDYKAFYPGSFLYQLTLTCAVTCVVIALGLAGFRAWEYATNKLN
jgi:predicted membrane-bound mannosyltransferase